jgi:muramoyltetrapeptide carboxypeptidase
MKIDRRQVLGGLGVLPLVGGLAFARPHRRRELIKPQALKPGSTVAIISPAGPLDPGELDRAVANIESLGFKAKVGKSAGGKNGFLAGTDAERYDDLHAAFADRSIEAVWCSRGGYGVTRLLPMIDFELIRKNPKIVIGYSDITALLLSIYQHSGLVTFHGPVATSTFTDYSKSNALDVLMGKEPDHSITFPQPPATSDAKPTAPPVVITSRKCSGQTIGGNLSLIGAMAGTPYAIGSLKNKVLFLEDVNEPLYKVDRLLTQLLQSTDVRTAAGIVLGQFTTGGNPAAETIDVVKDRLGSLEIPVVYGFPFGHIREQFTIPICIRADLDTDKMSLRFTEKAVQ